MVLSDDLWVSDISTRFPDATLRLLTGVPMGDRVLELGEVQANAPEKVTDAIRRHPDISAHETMYADDMRVIARYEADERSLYEFLWNSSLPPEFPIVVENGEMEFGLTATQEQFEVFGAALDDRERRYELLSLVHTDDRETVVTERQRECLTIAEREGYFDVPRACTLAEIAETLDVDKSTASETIRRATGRIVRQFLLSHD